MVTPLLPEPGVWTGMASANVWAPLRWKHAKIHRGSAATSSQAASRSRIYVSTCDCCTEPSHPVAIGRDPYTSTHDPKRTSSSARPGPVAAGSAVAVNSSVETCNVDSYRVRAIATLTQINKSMTARSPASEVDP